MSQFLHLKDKFGNDMWFGNTGEVRLAARPNVQDYSKQLQRIRDIKLRHDDVIVVGYPKSGNNWNHQMIRMLLDGTTDLPALNVNSDSFFFLDAFGEECNLLPSEKPRAFMSHLPFRFLPRDVTEKKIKVVYLTRNPKDVTVSLWCHVSNLTVPPGYGGTWPQFFEVMLEHGFWYGDVFDHMKDWEKEINARPGHPIFHSTFEETKKNTVDQVEKLDKFLGTGRGRELCEAIVMTCQLGNMHMTRRHEFTGGKDPWCHKDGASNNAFYRKGMVGDWKNWFTVAQNERFDDVYTTKMAGSKRTFAFE